MTLVSIIIPCFNRAHLISSAIESALDQSYPDIEIIVIDDCSTDDSWAVISSFGERIKAIRLVENGGVSRARNIGVSHARSKLVKFLDSDDMLEPTAVERQLEDLACLPEMSIPVGTARSIDADGQPLAIEFNRLPCPADGNMVPLAAILVKGILGSTALFPTAVLIQLGGFREDMSYAEDFDLNLRIHRAGYRFFLFDTPNAKISRHHGHRLTRPASGRVFGRLDKIYRDHLAAFDARAEGPLGPGERTGYAQQIWFVARRAANQGFIAEAQQLFSLATEIGGRQARVGSRKIRFLYNFADPVTCEIADGAVNRLLGRHP